MSLDSVEVIKTEWSVQRSEVVRVFLGVSHKLGTEVADGKEVIRPFNQLSVVLLENWQSVEAHKI